MQISDSYSINRDRQENKARLNDVPERDVIKDAQDVHRFEKALSDIKKDQSLVRKDDSNHPLNGKISKEAQDATSKMLDYLIKKMSDGSQDGELSALQGNTKASLEGVSGKDGLLQSSAALNGEGSGLNGTLANKSLSDEALNIANLQDLAKDAMLSKELHKGLNADSDDVQRFKDGLKSGESQLNALNAESLKGDALKVDNSAAVKEASMEADLSKVDDIFEATKKIIDKVMVSSKEHQSSEIVTISFNKNSPIPGTELTMRRDLDGLLTVVMSTNNPRSFKLLSDVREKFEKGLESLESTPIRFEVVNVQDATNDLKKDVREQHRV